MNEPTPTYRFGPFELDVTERELRRDGVRVKIQDQPFEILATLAAHPGELITREALQARLWPDGAFVDADNGLNSAIKKLREALHDAADSPRYIETVPRRGYRFMAVVDHKTVGDAAASRRPKIVAATALVFALVLVAAFIFLRPVADTAPPGKDRYKLAVLPFEDLGPDTAHAYIGEGLTEEVITVLAQLEPARLGVIARNSSMSYRDSAKPIQEIGRELGVDYVLEGSVRKEANQLRVTAQLIRVDDHTHLWAETLERDFGEVLELQSEIARRVAGSLKPVLLTNMSEPTMRLSQNKAALDAYWKGRFYWHQGGEAHLRKSLEYYDEALAQDPEFALAHAGVADSYNYLGMMGYGTAEETYGRAKQSAANALLLNDQLAAAHAAMGFALMYDDWEWQAAGQSLMQALELDPGRAIVNHWAASYYSVTAQHDRAVMACERAQDLDPLSLNVNSDLAWYYYYARQFDDALRQTQRTIDLNPAAGGLRLCAVLSFQAQGAEREAFDQLREMLVASSPRGTSFESFDKRFEEEGLSGVWLWLGDRNAARSTPSTYFVAASYALAGEPDSAVEWIQQAFTNHEGWVPFVPVDPAFDSLRDDPRLAALVTNIGL